VQYINSAQIRLYTNALTSVLQSVAPELAEITAPACTGGYVQPAPPFSPESDATITAVYEVKCKSSNFMQMFNDCMYVTFAYVAAVPGTTGSVWSTPEAHLDQRDAGRDTHR